MFDLPAAKRIRRADLYSPPSSPSPSEPDEELTALLHSQLEHVYGPVVTDRQLYSKNQNTENGEPHPTPIEPSQGFEFRLFATPAAKQKCTNDSLRTPNGTAPALVTRIILDDGPDAGDLSQQGRFVVPRREDGYYFSGAVAPAQREKRRKEFEIAAVSGEDVKRWLGVQYSGWEVRWRVRVLRNGELVVAKPDIEEVIAAPLAEDLGPNEPNEAETGTGIGRKKGKPGKKRRIILRMRKRKVEEAARRRREEAERKKKQEREREEAEREKRTRRNREKKIKKRAKEREKKAKSEENDLGVAEGDSNSELE